MTNQQYIEMRGCGKCGERLKDNYGWATVKRGGLCVNCAPKCFICREPLRSEVGVELYGKLIHIRFAERARIAEEHRRRKAVAKKRLKAALRNTTTNTKES